VFNDAEWVIGEEEKGGRTESGRVEGELNDAMSIGETGPRSLFALSTSKVKCSAVQCSE
jgi:hypothetical protein